jgi:hypothetical protein
MHGDPLGTRMRKDSIADFAGRKCITSRKRKLCDLYHATVALTPESLRQLNNADPQEHRIESEADFLEANNILQ